MPHLSGFGGSILFTGTPAPTWEATVVAWKLKTSRASLPIRVMRGDGMEGQPQHMQGVSEWMASVVFLVPDSWSADDYDLQEVSIELAVRGGQGWVGRCLIETLEVDCPLDGPVTAAATVRGTFREGGTPTDDKLTAV